MKNLTKAFTSFLAIAFSVVCLAATAFAEEELEDIEMSVVRAVQTNGAWSQSITYSQSDLSASRFTEDTTIRVEYELEGEPALENAHQVELVLQNYTADPQIWAQVVPVEYDDTYAIFDYASMVLAYGNEDLSTVNNICVGDRGIKMKVTSFTVTNCTKPVAVTTVLEEAEAVTEVQTEAPAETAAVETTTVAEQNSENANGTSMTMIIIIVVATVVVAGGIVTFIVIKKNRRRFY